MKQLTNKVAYKCTNKLQAYLNHFIHYFTMGNYKNNIVGLSARRKRQGDDLIQGQLVI